MILHYIKHFFTLLLMCALVQYSNAQTEVLSLDECYRLSKANFPAIKKMDLIARTSDDDIRNAGKRFLPQVNFSGQASYQSQTVSFTDVLGSLPGGISLPSVSKDQYKVQGEVSQLLYDGGNTKNQKELIKANAAFQQENLEVSLYALNNRINSIFFSILLMDAQLKQNELNKANLQTQLQKAETALANGVAFRSSINELKAEIMTVEMQATEYKANKMAGLKMLSLFTGKQLPEGTRLLLPESEDTRPVIARPELKAFELQKRIVDTQEKQLRSDHIPQVSAFLQGAYGRPTLNIIENKFGPWYITGLRFSWSLGTLYSLKNKKHTLSLSRQSIDADRETFLLNTRLDLTLQDEQILKYTELLQQDNEAIALRASVVQSAEAQLSNGVITTHEYIQKVNAEQLARQTKILHEIQLLQARYNQKFISGNEK